MPSEAKVFAGFKYIGHAAKPGLFSRISIPIQNASEYSHLLVSGVASDKRITEKATEPPDRVALSTSA
jgi:hypothetical protein